MDKDSKKSLMLLWKYPVIWIAAFFMFMYPIGNILVYSVRLFFGIKTGNTFDYDPFITRLSDIGIMDISFEISFIIVVYIFARYVDKFSFADLGLKLGMSSIYQFAAGILAAGIFISLPFLFYLVTGTVHIKGNFWNLSQDESFQNLAIFQLIQLTLVAVQEDLFHRAYLINNLRKMKPAAVMLLTSTVFSCAHLLSIGFDQLTVHFMTTVIGLINIFIIGWIYAWYFYYRRDLWFVIGAHLSWNFLMGPIFGFPISGLPGKGLLVIEESGSSLLTGGTFGPEGGIVVTFSLLLMFIAVRKYVRIIGNKNGQ